MKKLLIANRGEIACRIIKTAHRLNIKTVAIYSTVDKQAQHVDMADEAYCVGGPASTDSYLNQAEIFRIAKEAHVDAIHPGYGFLAENAEFAKACEKHDIQFVGPTSKAIAAMGDKSAAKHMMAKAGIPITPGYLSTLQSPDDLLEGAKKVGFPLLIKACAGGGGKGMRLVSHIDDFLSLLAEAQREAKSSFGSDEVLLERYLNPVRHIEVQLFFDHHGNGVTLLDRDCSLQRRHQKVIEEAPAPNLSDKTKLAMQETAIKAGKLINYRNAGTIEFLVDQDENFYFMEMNTRLQVEHPVTEMITGLDCVEWQLRIARGEPLPLQQRDIPCHGHAFEARLCAEDPARQFSPSLGTLEVLQFPTQDSHCRIDSGVRQGDTISPYYDSMIAKIISYHDSRENALTHLSQLLTDTAIIGVQTNLSFLHRLTQQNHFKNATHCTQTITNNVESLTAVHAPSDAILIAAALAILKAKQTERSTDLTHSQDPHSPWGTLDQWRLDGCAPYFFRFKNATNHETYQLSLDISFKDVTATINEQITSASFKWISEHTLELLVGHIHLKITAFYQNHVIHLFNQGEHYSFLFHQADHDYEEDESSDDQCRSPMPGTITMIHTEKGQKVAAGDCLLRLEAMKMEHRIEAPFDGMVKTIHYQVGDFVNEGDVLVEIEAN